ncbi:MAG: sel1 repeat family protein [Parachlamydiaceae bacterium]|nr:sel1 repeat family protein [Parachlamydiaceae bacterium]
MKHPEAYYQLAKCYENGSGVVASQQTAFEYLKIAASLDHPAANYELAQQWTKVARGSPKILINICYFYKKAAEKNHPEAMYEYALCLRDGLGVEKNIPEFMVVIEEASRYTEKAKKEYAQALYLRAKKELEMNENERAEASYELAIKLGNKEALVELQQRRYLVEMTRPQINKQDCLNQKALKQVMGLNVTISKWTAIR